MVRTRTRRISRISSGPCGDVQQTLTHPPFLIQGEPTLPGIEMAQAMLTYRFLKPLPRSRFSVFDVGAASGWYALFWCALGFNATAFEPGETSNLETNRMCNAFEMKLNIHHVGLGSIGGHGSGTAYRHNESGRSEVVLSLRPFIEPGSEIALLKIDTEGREIFALESVLRLVRSGHCRVHGILVEVSPSWWVENHTRGLAVFQRYVDLGWQVLYSPWGLHGLMTASNPHALAPPAQAQNLSWDDEPLHAVQHVRGTDFAPFLSQMARLRVQRDFLLQSPTTPFPLDLADNGVSPLLCSSPRELRYAQLPRYMTDRRLTEQCTRRNVGSLSRWRGVGTSTMVADPDE